MSTLTIFVILFFAVAYCGALKPDFWLLTRVMDIKTDKSCLAKSCFTENLFFRVSHAIRRLNESSEFEWSTKSVQVEKQFTSSWTHGFAEDVNVQLSVINYDPSFGFPRVCDATFQVNFYKIPQPITAEVLSSKDDHLAYWLNDNAASVSMHGNGPCVRRSVESVVSSPPIGQVDAPETPKRVEQSTTPLTQYQHYQRQEQEQPRPEVVVLSPGMRSPSTLAPMSTLPAAAAQVNLRPSSARAHANPRDKIIHLIALNIPMSGNMKGLRGVDRECYHASRIAGFKTTFRAFVSNRVQDLFQVVHHADRDTPVVNARGEQLFERWEDAFSTTITPQDRPIYSFDHRNIYDDPTWQDRYIWHGSDDNGRRVDNAYCEGWRSENSYAHGMASQLIRGRPLVNEGEQVTCHRKLIVLCIENMSKYNIDLLLSRHRVIRRKK